MSTVTTLAPSTLQSAERIGYSAITRISRKDFGLTWNQILETGGVAVGDEVTVSVELQLVRASSVEDAGTRSTR